MRVLEIWEAPNQAYCPDLMTVKRKRKTREDQTKLFVSVWSQTTSVTECRPRLENFPPPPTCSQGSQEKGCCIPTLSHASDPALCCRTLFRKLEPTRPAEALRVDCPQDHWHQALCLKETLEVGHLASVLGSGATLQLP